MVQTESRDVGRGSNIEEKEILLGNNRIDSSPQETALENSKVVQARDEDDILYSAARNRQERSRHYLCIHGPKQFGRPVKGSWIHAFGSTGLICGFCLFVLVAFLCEDLYATVAPLPQTWRDALAAAPGHALDALVYIMASVGVLAVVAYAVNLSNPRFLSIGRFRLTRKHVMLFNAIMLNTFMMTGAIAQETRNVTDTSGLCNAVSYQIGGSSALDTSGTTAISGSANNYYCYEVCRRGSYNPTLGASDSCESCPAGKTNAVEGSTSCAITVRNAADQDDLFNAISKTGNNIIRNGDKVNIAEDSFTCNSVGSNCYTSSYMFFLENLFGWIECASDNADCVLDGESTRTVIFVDGTWGQALTLRALTFKHGTRAAYIRSGAKVDIALCIFSGCSTGAIYVTDSSTNINVYASRFIGNTGASGSLEDINRISGTITIHDACPYPYNANTPTRGKHSGSGVSSCQACAAGRYLINPATAEESSACAICPQGSYADNEATVSCTTCPAGRFNADNSSSPDLHSSISGIAATTCDWCDIGKFASGTNNTVCTYCDDKDVLKGSTTKYTGSNSSSACECEAGEYKNDKTNTCEAVFEGVSTSVAGQTVPTMTLEEGCMTTTSFYDTLLVYTGFPIFVILVLGLSYVCVSNQTLKNALFEAVLATTFLILPSVSVKIFSTFACHDFDDGTSYLKVDYSLSCRAAEYSFYRLYAAGMVLVYPLGIPFSYWLLLFRRRKQLDGGQTVKEEGMAEDQALKEALKEREENEALDPNLKALGFLYEQYEPKYYWFEVFETLRKLALTGFLVFMVPGTAAQILLSLIINLASMRVYSGKKPFIEDFYDGFSEVAQWQLFFTLLGALAMKVNLDDASLSTRAYFDYILTGMQFVPLFLVTAFYAAHAGGRVKMSNADALGGGGGGAGG
ncbi:hypothetical protein TrRE_jg13386, partial [Triparma retinervis]